MALILGDLPDDDIKWFDQLAAERGKSRAAVSSMIIRRYRQYVEGSR